MALARCLSSTSSVPIESTRIGTGERRALTATMAHITPTVVVTIDMEASDFTAVLAQVASGTAATIAPLDVAQTFLAPGTTVQLPLVEPVVRHMVGLSIKDQSPPLPMAQALRLAVRASL